jgi:hypothetical protein
LSLLFELSSVTSIPGAAIWFFPALASGRISWVGPFDL